MITNTVATRITVDDQMTKHLQNAQRHMQTFAGQVDKQSSNISRDFARIATSVISVTAALQGIKKVVSEGISFNRFMQEQQTAFTVMMKSSDAAKAKIQELYDFAVNTPLTFKEATAAARQLMAYGFASDELIGSMRMLGTVSKATGHSLSDITYVYGTLRSQGRAYSRDLMQFGMRGIPIYEELGKVMGVSVEQLKKMTEEGKVGFKEVEQAFSNMTGSGGRFAGMLEEYMNTLSGKLSMLTDIFQQSAGKLSKGITDQVTSGLDSLMNVLLESGPVFAELGVYLGDIAGAMLQMVVNLIKLLPLIKVFIGIFVTAKILALISGLAKSFFMLGDYALNASLGIQALSKAMLGANLQMAFSSAATGLGLLVKQIGLFLANPIVATLLGIAAATGAIVSHVNKGRASDAAMMESDPAKLMRQKLANQSQAMGGGLQVSVQGVLDAMKIYNLSLRETIDNLKAMGYVSAEVTKEIERRIAAEATARGMGTRSGGLETKYELQREYFASLTGKAASTYREDSSGLSLGGKAAQDYLSQFSKQRTEQMAIYGDLFGDDEVKAMLSKQMDIVWDELPIAAERGTPAFVAALKDWYRKAEAEIADMGGGGTAKPLIKMDQWFDREFMVKATAHMYDDIQLAREKDLDKAREMLDEAKITGKQYIQAVAAIDQIYYNEKDRLRKEDLQKERDAALERFNLLAGGRSSYFEDARIKAEASFSAGNYGQGTASSMVAGMEGSPIGRLLSSTNRAATALIMFAEAAADTANQLVSEILSGINGLNIKQSTTNIANGISSFINNLTGASNAVEDLTNELENMKEEYNRLKTDFDLLVGAVKDMVGAQVKSMQDLYEVGAISGQAYEDAVTTLNTEMENNLKAAYDQAGLEYRTLADIVAKDSTLVEVYSRLGDVAIALGVSADAIDAQTAAVASAKDNTSGISDAVSMGMSGAAIGAAVGGPLGAAIGGVGGAIIGGLGNTFGWWDTGTTELAKDQFGMVHKGEAIIPKTFADGIRSGEMVLSGGGNSRSASLGGGDVYITVEGSVLTERELVEVVREGFARTNMRVSV